MKYDDPDEPEVYDEDFGDENLDDLFEDDEEAWLPDYYSEWLSCSWLEFPPSCMWSLETTSKENDITPKADMNETMHLKPNRLYKCQAENRKMARKDVWKDAFGHFHCSSCGGEVTDVTNEETGKNVLQWLGSHLWLHGSWETVFPMIQDLPIFGLS